MFVPIFLTKYKFGAKLQLFFRLHNFYIIKHHIFSFLSTPLYKSATHTRIIQHIRFVYYYQFVANNCILPTK